MSLDTLHRRGRLGREPRRAPRRWPLVVAGVLLALVAVYVVAAAWLGDRVPRGTTVSGVAVGGQSGRRGHRPPSTPRSGPGPRSRSC